MGGGADYAHLIDLSPLNCSVLRRACRLALSTGTTQEGGCGDFFIKVYSGKNYWNVTTKLQGRRTALFIEGAIIFFIYQ